MRLSTALLLPVLCVACTACIPQATAPSDTDLGTLVAGITESSAASPASAAAASEPSVVTGSVSVSGDYQLIALGAGQAGEELTVTNDKSYSSGRSFLIALFDSDYSLLRREVLTSRTSLDHILRTDTGALYLGVTPPTGASGGDFRFTVSRQLGVPVPQPCPQVLWLNFGGSTGVSVHARAPIAFPAFDAATLGSAYVGATDTVKAGIAAALREDYAAYDVVVLTSDDGPPPAGPYATVHFGGSDNRLLGLADNVDQYNGDPWQTAVVYVEGFADFSVMALTPAELGQMVGNVASHEFGHLLGLFHTKVPKDVMDTTGTAWDLAADQAFLVADLESNVFPFGNEDSPRRLAETVGHNPNPTDRLAKPDRSQRMAHKAMLRGLARDLLHGRCGTCLDLDN